MACGRAGWCRDTARPVRAPDEGSEHHEPSCCQFNDVRSSPSPTPGREPLWCVAAGQHSPVGLPSTGDPGKGAHTRHGAGGIARDRSGPPHRIDRWRCLTRRGEVPPTPRPIRSPSRSPRLSRWNTATRQRGASEGRERFGAIPGRRSGRAVRHWLRGRRSSSRVIPLTRSITWRKARVARSIPSAGTRSGVSSVV